MEGGGTDDDHGDDKAGGEDDDCRGGNHHPQIPTMTTYMLIYLFTDDHGVMLMLMLLPRWRG